MKHPNNVVRSKLFPKLRESRSRSSHQMDLSNIADIAKSYTMLNTATKQYGNVTKITMKETLSEQKIISYIQDWKYRLCGKF